MFPRLTYNDLRDNGLVNTKPVSKLPLCDAALSVQGSYFPNGAIGQSGVVVGFASLDVGAEDKAVSPLLFHVETVVFVRSLEQVPTPRQDALPDRVDAFIIVSETAGNIANMPGDVTARRVSRGRVEGR